MTKEYQAILQVAEVIPILNQISIFGGFTESQLHEIVKLLRVVHYKEGEYVFKEGDAASHIYIIKEGEIKIMLDSEDGALELISFEVGDCFGESSVIGIQSHSSSALAVKDTTVIVMERSVLLSVFETDKDLFGLLILNIARETSRRLHKSDQALKEYILQNGKRPHIE